MMQQGVSKLLPWWLWLITQCVGWVFLGCLGCVVVAIVMSALHSQLSGFAKLQTLIRDDYRYLSLTLQPNTLLTLHTWLQRIPNDITVPTLKIPHVNLDKLWLGVIPLARAALLGAKLIVIRLYCLIHWCSLFFLLGCVSFIDGLTQRAIRRRAVGRESAFIYHHAKSLVMWSLGVGIFMNLILPISIIHAEWLFVMSAILFSVAVQIAAKCFKKYL